MNSDSDSELLKPSSYRDTVSTVTDSGSRKWIYALMPKGKFYNWRSLLAWVYLAVFFIIPFIKVDGLPLVMINLPQGKFVIFSKIFWPQDFYIFAIGMITMIIIVVLFTIIFGRLFCGWVCPQTIFMEFVFRKIEWLIDGNPMQQKKLHEQDWNWTKIWKRGLKIIVFFSLSFLISHTFLSYILGVDEVLKIIKEPLSDNLGLFAGLLFFSFLFFSVYYFVRELVCTTFCPYGRLQGVMVDENTMQISYDHIRGNNPERFSKNKERTGGDCIDCLRCIDVCPTGIDIRNGIQMECVGCTACIDACDEMMAKVGFEPNLIKYASKNNIENKKKFEWTTRVKAYTVLLICLFGVLLTLIITRKSVDSYMSRVGGQLYQEVGKDSLSNYYEFKLINKTTKPVPFDFRADQFKGSFKVVGNKSKVLLPEAINAYYVWITIPKSEIKERSTKIRVQIVDQNNIVLNKVKSSFYGPFDEY